MGLRIAEYDVQRPTEGLNMWFVRGRSEIPELRRQPATIPFRHGRRSDPPIADVRILEIAGYVNHPNDRQAFIDQVDELKARLAPLGDPVLIVDTFGGQDRWIHARVVNALWDWKAPSIEVVSLEFEAEDPFWYSPYGVLNLDSGVEMDDDELMDAGGEIVVTPPTTQVTFDSMGNAQVERVRVRFVGPSAGIGIGIENWDTPDLVGFTIAQALAAGERITVNNYHRRARRDLGAGEGSVRADMTLRAGNRHGEYLYLVPGQNTLSILGEPAETRISFFPTWL